MERTVKRVKTPSVAIPGADVSKVMGSTAIEEYVAVDEKGSVVHPTEAVSTTLAVSSPPMYRMPAPKYPYEHKYYDFFESPAPIGSGYTPQCVNAIAAGLSYYQRVGYEVTPVSLHFKFQIEPASNSGDFVRVMVILDHQSSNTTVSQLALFDTSITGCTPYTGFINKGLWGDRFKVLFDWYSDELAVNAGSTPSAYLGSKPICHDVHIALHKKKVRYVDSGGNVPANDAIIVLCWPRSVSCSDYFGFQTRYEFVDS